MKSTITFALLFCSSTVLAQLAPSIESDGDDIVLRASGGDVKFVTQTGGTTSLQELIDVIQKLKQQVAEGDNSTANVDTAMLEIRRVQSELQDSIDAAANNAAQTTAEARATLNSRVDTLVEDMTLSKSAMDGTMEDFAQNIKVLQDHVEGVVTCAKDGRVHDGDDCIAAVSTCEMLSAPKDGVLKTSGHDSESTPGVSAHLTCKEGMFPKGAVKTICLSTGEWSDELGACTECTLKGCEVCSTEKTCSKCNAASLLLDNGTCGSIPKSCADLYAQGKRKNGIYRLTSGDAKQTYKQHCILEDTDHYTGGWTRFVRVEPGCESLNAFDNDCARGYTKSRTGCWEFDGKIMAQASDKQVMAVGQGDLKRKYIAKLPASSGQDFVEMLTGDRGGMPEWYEWSKKSFVQGEGGNCNTNDHTQWNCVPQTGLHVHYASRSCLNDGGAPAPRTMYCDRCTNNEDWWLGFSAMGQSDAENLGRFVSCDGECGWDDTITRDGIRGDQHGAKRTAAWLYYK